MKLVVFRSEASPEIGAGHIMRCLSLADKLAEKDWICYFACSSSTVETVSDLANSKHRTLELTLQSQNQPQYLMSLFPQGIELLVVDHYELDSNYESSCRPWASAILAIDDLANRTHDADILLDQTINRPKTDYKNLTPNDCWILIGPEYALLREEFSKNRSSALCERDRRPPKLDRILVSLGSQDLSDTTSLVLNNIYSFLDGEKVFYCPKSEKYVDLLKEGIIDPKKVTRIALENAASVAGMILTTECALVDIKEESPAMPPMGGGGGGMPGMM